MNWLENKIRIVQKYTGKNRTLYASVLMPDSSSKRNWAIDYFPIDEALEIVLGRKGLFLPKGIGAIKIGYKIEFGKRSKKYG